MKSKRLPTQDYIGPQIKTLSILIEKKDECSISCQWN